MSNKPHQRPHQEKRQASRKTRLLVAILIIAIFALVIALEATGHVVFRGRLTGTSFGWERSLGQLKDERLRWLPDVSVLK